MTDLIHHLTLFLREVKAKQGKPLLVIAGPTASGKTDISLRLAQQFDGEIISADSAQVYRRMDIGTAKVTPEEQKIAKHHLIDIREPSSRFTMADFQREAKKAIKEIHSKGKLPIICGGTGLYINSITQNYQLATAPPNQELRDELQELYEKEGKDGLYQMLLKLDPVAAAKIHPNNVRYVARALEIVMQTDAPKQDKTAKTDLDVFKIGIEWDRELLYERINKRVDKQIEAGLLAEIKALLDEGLPEETQAFQALGYKEYFPYFRGEKSLEDCKDTLKQATRNFAKRQLSWFRKEEDIYWIQPEEWHQITGK